MRTKEAEEYIESVFQHGIELYDRTAKAPTNVGGAQVYQLTNYKFLDGSVIWNDEKFGETLKSFGATLYSINKILLDKDGNPMKVPNDPTKNMRTDSGLLIYTQYGEDGNLARDWASKIIEEHKELDGYVVPVVDMIEKHPKLGLLGQVQLQSTSSVGPIKYMNPLKCIILAVQSGSPGSSQLWAYNPEYTARRKGLKSTRTRGGLNLSHTLGTSAVPGNLIDDV